MPQHTKKKKAEKENKDEKKQKVSQKDYQDRRKIEKAIKYFLQRNRILLYIGCDS